MDRTYVNIHTHRPTGRHIELRTAGIHPWEAGRRSADTLPPFDDGVQAVGEIGLDYACDVPREAQLTLFREQLRIARERGLPVVLHCVRAFEATMRELAAIPPARRDLARLHRLARTGAAGARPRPLPLVRRTHLRFAQNARGTARDAPRAALRRNRRERHPIETLYARIAEARGTDAETLRRAVRANYERIFGTRHG